MRGIERDAALAAQLDTVFEDVQMMWFDGSREPVVVPIARALGLIFLLRATYVLPTEYKGGFRRYDVIDLTKKLSTVAIAESEYSNLRVGL